MFGTTKRNTGRMVAAATAALLAATACAPQMDTATVQPAPDGVVMTPANITGIATTVNTGEIELGQLALERSRDQAVRQFAQRMITEHGQSNRDLMQLAQDMGTAPATNRVTQQLTMTVEETAEALRTREGESFDRTYIQNQVELHRWALQTIDDTLLPTARSNDLRRELTEMRAMVANHLQQAQQIQATL